MESETLVDTTAVEELTEDQTRELDERSQPFLGKWSRLISTTNWDKGAIIVEWQEAMEKSKLPKRCFSDEAWSQFVGGATPQHIGRLRRTFKRYGHVFGEYEGLFWSHFYAALDWDDAEMWLEGSLQNRWSVSQMRNKRWETMGSKPEDEPKIEQIVVSEVEEETHALAEPGKVSADDREYTEGPRAEDPDFGDDSRSGSGSGSSELADNLTESEAAKAEKIRPFESFKNLPADIQSATSSFKVAIIKHKAEDWQEISLDDMHALLDALKALTTSASE